MITATEATQYPLSLTEEQAHKALARVSSNPLKETILSKAATEALVEALRETLPQQIEAHWIEEDEAKCLSMQIEDSRSGAK